MDNTSIFKKEREARIRAAAYCLAEARGFASGDAFADWLAAEAEVDAQIAAEASEYLRCWIVDWDLAVTELLDTAKPVGGDVLVRIEDTVLALRTVRATAVQRLVELNHANAEHAGAQLDVAADSAPRPAVLRLHAIGGQ